MELGHTLRDRTYCCNALEVLFKYLHFEIVFMLCFTPAKDSHLLLCCLPLQGDIQMRLSLTFAGIVLELGIRTPKINIINNVRIPNNIFYFLMY